MSYAKFNVQIPNQEYFIKLVNCQERCPVHTPSGSYIQKIASCDYEGSYNLARGPNPFVYTCARICAHPCEDACRRGKIDEPLAICALKRIATDHHNLGLGHASALRVFAKRKEKVAIVGAGPCGLSCAHELALLGYDVSVFEAQEIPGGMLYLGIPTYRLPREIIKTDIDFILNLGVKLKTNVALGRDFTLGQLGKEGYGAIFIATGAAKARELAIEGAELDGVLNGIDFLLNANRGYKVELGRKVVVIGGGNVALDVARTAARAEGVAEREDGFIVAIDVSRTALRRGAREVHVISLESRDQLPAYKWEIEESEREGIIFHTSLGPKRITGAEGKVRGLVTWKVKSLFDKDGKFSPSFFEGSEDELDSDSIILAIGQTPDLSFISSEDNIKKTPRGTIQIDPDTFMTSSAGIFAGGDVAFGPRLVIDAIADGRKAARAMHMYISGGEAKVVTKTQVRILKDYEPLEYYDRIKRHKMPTLALDRRVGIAEVELGFSDDVAKEEAARCLRCQINTIFDSDKCILCGGCVDICPYNCLRLVSLERVENSQIAELTEAGFGEAAAIIKDEDSCLRCGLCARRCPTGAITMEEFSFQEEMSDG